MGKKANGRSERKRLRISSHPGDFCFAVGGLSYGNFLTLYHTILMGFTTKPKEPRLHLYIRHFLMQPA
jgi:hypothetical protein